MSETGVEFGVRGAAAKRRAGFSEGEHPEGAGHHLPVQRAAVRWRSDGRDQWSATGRHEGRDEHPVGGVLDGSDLLALRHHDTGGRNLPLPLPPLPPPSHRITGSRAGSDGIDIVVSRHLAVSAANFQSVEASTDDCAVHFLTLFLDVLANIEFYIQRL